MYAVGPTPSLPPEAEWSDGANSNLATATVQPCCRACPTRACLRLIGWTNPCLTYIMRSVFFSVARMGIHAFPVAWWNAVASPKASPAQPRRLASRLLAADTFCGWGTGVALGAVSSVWHAEISCWSLADSGAVCVTIFVRKSCAIICAD